MKNLVIFVVVLGLLGFGANGAYNWYNGQTQPVSNHSVKVAVKVVSNETSTEIGDDLYSKGLIRSREVWQLYVRLNNLTAAFQAGDYTIDKSWSMEQIAEALQHGNVAQFSFTIPEGYTIGRIAQKWEAEGHGKAQDYDLDLDRLVLDRKAVQPVKHRQPLWVPRQYPRPGGSAGISRPRHGRSNSLAGKM